MSVVDDNKKIEELDHEKELKEDSHKMTGKYAILMETSGGECESWLYFIRVEGNEENLRHLQDQLEQVEWYILDEMSTFDLDLDNYVSAQTAKEMSKVDLNHHSFHRKFDGKLEKIDLGFSEKDKNKKKIKKAFEILGYGLIEDFIGDEDVDQEDLVSGSEESEDTDNESVSSSESEDRNRNRNYNAPPPSVLRQKLKERIEEDKAKRRKGYRRREDEY